MERLAPDSPDSEAQVHRTDAALTNAYVASPATPVPEGARRVTFYARLTRNAASAGNRARIAVQWNVSCQLEDGSLGARTIREPAVDATTAAVVAGELQTDVYPGAWSTASATAAPPAAVTQHFTFEVPAGAQSVQLLALEYLDVANPGTLEALIAFSGLM